MDYHTSLDLWIVSMLLYITSLLTSSLFWTTLAVLAGFVALVETADGFYDDFKNWRKGKKRENLLAR